MEDKHIDLIISNIDELIQLTDYPLLMKECVNMEILFPSMQNEIEQNTVDVKERHLKLLTKITKRGPNAFTNFMQILNNNFIGAARLLIAVPIESVSSNINNINSNNNTNTNINKSNNFNNNNNNFSNINNTNNNTNNTNNNNNTNIRNHEKDISLRSKRKLWNRPVIAVTPRKFEPFTIEVNPTVPITVKHSTKIYYHQKIDCYSMKSRNRGVFFLVNNIKFKDGRTRNGASVDRDNLVTLFRGMGFTIYYYEDLTCQQFFLLVKELVNSRDLRLTDCLVFALLTHGELKDEVQYVEFSDCSAATIKEILEKFNNDNCRHLFNKPKIFLFPFCRGHVSDGGVNYTVTKEISTENDSTLRWVKESINVPTYSDMHVCYASVRGFQTHRDPTFGSWYIELMCQIYAEHAHETAFEDLLKMVGNSVGQRRSEKNYLQTASNENIGFNKVLYFNPGYYET